MTDAGWDSFPQVEIALAAQDDPHSQLTVALLKNELTESNTRMLSNRFPDSALLARLALSYCLIDKDHKHQCTQIKDRYVANAGDDAFTQLLQAWFAPDQTQAAAILGSSPSHYMVDAQRQYFQSIDNAFKSATNELPTLCRQIRAMGIAAAVAQGELRAWETCSKDVGDILANACIDWLAGVKRAASDQFIRDYAAHKELNLREARGEDVEDLRSIAENQRMRFGRTLSRWESMDHATQSRYMTWMGRYGNLKASKMLSEYLEQEGGTQ